MFCFHMKLLTCNIGDDRRCAVENKIFLILKVDRRRSPMIADAAKNFVFINRNSSAMVADGIANDRR